MQSRQGDLERLYEQAEDLENNAAGFQRQSEQLISRFCTYSDNEFSTYKWKGIEPYAFGRCNSDDLYFIIINATHM